MACAFQENTCNVGVICGTGSNACYMERIDRIKKLNGEIKPEEDGLPAEVCHYLETICNFPIQMCVNTEWVILASLIYLRNLTGRVW